MLLYLQVRTELEPTHYIDIFGTKGRIGDLITQQLQNC